MRYQIPARSIVVRFYKDKLDTFILPKLVTFEEWCYYSEENDFIVFRWKYDETVTWWVPRNLVQYL